MAMSKTGKVLLTVGGILTVVVLVAIIGIALLLESMGAPDVPENSVLVLRVSGDLPDYAPEDPMAKFVGINQPQSFTSLLTQLRKAKVDTRIGAVMLDIDFPGIGWAKAEELRDAIKDFRASGKPAYAYMEIGTNKEYFIATAAEKIFLPPSGDLYVNGFAAEAMFYRGSLDKLGIEADVIRIGEYKTAPEQYTRKDLSPAQREVLDAVLNEYYGRFSGTIAETRKKSIEDVKAIIDNAPYHATEAQQQGLIDGANYKEQVYEELRNRLGYKQDDKLRKISGAEYREIASDTLGLNQGERIAVIYASGAITGGQSSSSPLGGQMVGSDTLVKAINDAADDTTIKAIVLRVDSPGGSALASDLMWYAIENAKSKKKPVVVSMADVAASGGYYIACNADKIVAEPTTITGSIGVFLGKPVMKGFYDWLGVSNEYVMRGKNAGIFRETVKWTDEERAKMQDQANKIYYGDFVPKVAKGRGKTDEQVNQLGQGRVWTGTQAKERGLIDEFGGLEKAIEIAKQLANLPADKEVKRVPFPEARPFLESFFGSGDDNASADAKQREAQEALFKALPEDTRRALRFASFFDRMKNGEAMLILPYELQIK
jgi:protease-4